MDQVHRFFFYQNTTHSLHHCSRGLDTLGKEAFSHLQKSYANSEGSNSYAQENLATVNFDYLIHAKSIFDLLASAGSNMAKAELVEYALYGLQHEDKEFTTSIHLRQFLTFDEFFNLLQEKQLQKRMSTLSLSTKVEFATDRVAQDQSGNKPHSNNYKGQGGGRGHIWIMGMTIETIGETLSEIMKVGVETIEIEMMATLGLKITMVGVRLTLDTIHLHLTSSTAAPTPSKYSEVSV